MSLASFRNSDYDDSDGEKKAKPRLNVSNIGLQRSPFERAPPAKSNSYSPVTVIKQGYMTKQGGNRKNWKKRWFSLQKGGGEVPRLYYYKNLNENIRGQDPLNCIYLDGVKINRTHKDRFEVDCATRTFFLRTESDDDCDDWVKMLLNEISSVERSAHVRKGSITESQRIEFEGYLVKQGQKIKTKKKRWFVLRGKKLLYYKDESKTSPLGMIDLETCLKVTKGGGDGKGGYNFEVLTINRNFPLLADTKDEMDRWFQLISEKIDKSKSLLSYSEASARHERDHFSSESSEDEEERPSNRTSQNPEKVEEPAPPNESIPVEEYLPPTFQTQTAPVPAAATSARPLLDTDSVFELDLEAMKSNLNVDYEQIENLFEELLMPAEGEEKSLSGSLDAEEPLEAYFQPGSYENSEYSEPQSPSPPVPPTPLPTPVPPSTPAPTPSAETFLPRPNRQSSFPEPTPGQHIRKPSSTLEGVVIPGVPSVSVATMTMQELAQLLGGPTQLVNHVAACNELVDRFQKDAQCRKEAAQLEIGKSLKELSASDSLPLKFYSLRCMSALAMDDENRTIICRASGIPALLRPLKSLTEDIRVKKQALRVLINLSFTDVVHVQNDFKRNSGLSCLIGMLSVGAEELKGLCLQVLMNASANEENALELVQLGVVKLLSSFLGGDLQIYQRYSCFIITNLSCHDAGKTECEQQAILPLLIALLRSPAQEIQYEALRALTNISNSEISKVLLRQLGAIPPLVTILGRAIVERKPENEKILLHSLWTLTNMATNSENQMEIAQKGVLPFMSAALLNANHDIRHQAVWGIANLSTNKHCRDKFDEIVSTALIELLQKGSIEIRGQAVKAIANLALDEYYRIEIGKLGGCGVLLEIVQSKNENLRIYDHALVALLNLSLEGYCRDAVRLSNGLGTILLVIKDQNAKESNTVNALKLFTNLAFTEANRAAFLTMKAVPLIHSLRNSPVPAIAQQAARAAQMMGLTT